MTIRKIMFFPPSRRKKETLYVKERRERKAVLWYPVDRGGKGEGERSYIPKQESMHVYAAI